MSADSIRAKTLAAMKHHGWRVVFLGLNEKRPRGTHWNTTTDPGEAARHVGNLGLVVGPGVAVIDFDNASAAWDMFRALGPLPLWSQGNPSKPGHAYVRWHEALHAGPFEWDGVRVGEVFCGPWPDRQQQVVLPGSIHPDTGLPYRWLLDPCQPLPELPDSWQRHFGLVTDNRPEDYLGHEGAGVPPEEPWTGPPAEEVHRRAARQPGAVTRGGKTTFQCPGCAAEGHDRRGREHAVVFDDGRFTCVVNVEHRRSIALALDIAAKANGFVPSGVPGLTGLFGLRGI